MSSTQPAYLIIVMGTSGSGKSTLGSNLAQALGLTFIDGDDLHPKANVDKMSRGEPLQDTDREGWLQTLRNRAWEIIGPDHTPSQANNDGLDGGDHSGTSTTQQRLLAEVFETSAGVGVDSERQLKDIKAQVDTEDALTATEEEQKEGGPVNGAVVAAPSSTSTTSTTAATSDQPTSPRAIVIACSALKKTYRSLLRGEITSLPTTSSPSPPPNTSSPLPSELRTIHIYVEVSPEELLRRMHDRKGHFMKESMLKSQLETLQKPIEAEEEGVVVLQNGEPEIVVAQAVERVRKLMQGKS